MVMENKKNERLVFDIRRKLKPWQEHYLKSYGIFPQRGEFLGHDREEFDCYRVEFSRGGEKCGLQDSDQGYTITTTDGLAIGFDYNSGRIVIPYKTEKYDIFVKAEPDKINMTFRCPKTGEEVKIAVFSNKEKDIKINLYSERSNINDLITISSSDEVFEADDYIEKLVTVIDMRIKDAKAALWLKTMATDPRLKGVLCKLLSRIRKKIDSQSFQEGEKGQEHMLTKATKNR